LWFGVEWFVSSLAMQLVLTGSVFALSIISGGMLLAILTEHLREDQLRRVVACLSVVTLLCALTSAVLFGIGRMTSTPLAETQQLSQQGDDLGSGSAAASALVQRAQAAARRLERLGILWGILLAVAGDLGTLIAVHQWMRHRTVVRTV